MKQFVKLDKKNKISVYSLTDKGKEAIKLIKYFTKFYSFLLFRKNREEYYFK